MNGTSDRTEPPSVGRESRWRAGCVVGLASATALGLLVSVAGISVYRNQQANLQRLGCESNLKQQGVAAHFFHDEHRQLPPRSRTEGEPVSWRVDLLPYLERGDLFAKYDPTQAWDSPANRPVADAMPETFACPAHPAERGPNRTSYFAIVGEDTTVDPRRPVTLSDIYDGPSNTLLYIESSEHDVIWTAPQDVPVDDLMPPNLSNRTAGPRGFHRGAANVVYADGSVRSLSASIDPEVFRALTTRGGGESVEAP